MNIENTAEGDTAPGVINSDKPRTVSQLLQGREPNHSVFRTTSENRILYITPSSGDEPGSFRFVGRTTNDVLSFFTAKPEYPVDLAGKVERLDFVGPINRGMSRYAELDALLTQNGVPELGDRR